MRFVLDPVDTNEGIRAGFTGTGSRGESGDGIKPHSRRSIAMMGQSDFDSVREARELDLQMGVLCGQGMEDFDASGHDRRLQLCPGVVRQPRGVGEKARRAADRCGQTSVGVNLYAEALDFSDHGCWLKRHRTLPGNPGSNRDRPCRGAHCAALCRWCNTFHKCSALPANHTACRR